MKLGVLTACMPEKTLEEALSYLSSLGVQTVELGAAGYTRPFHLDIKKLISDDSEVERVKGLLKKYNMTISALSAHGNPVHPDKETAKAFHDQFADAVIACEKLGVDTIIGFSGCPGDSDSSKLPNWVTCTWPNDFTEILEWQWNEKIIPYWKDMAEFCKAHGIKKIAFEMHPGFCVYNVPSLLRLRAAVGDIIGANFDPSHLIWQGVDPAIAIRALKGCIYHFHAKDTFIDPTLSKVNGVLVTGKDLTVADRAWTFRTVGYGTDTKAWKDMMSALATIGYDGAISIEHEDPLMTIPEGLEKAIAFLKDIIPFETANQDWLNDILI